MRSHKTGCGRCRRNVCCCPRAVTSCICPPGPPGPEGPPGPPGSMGLPGPGTDILNALKFSGFVEANEFSTTAYLADVGTRFAPGDLQIGDPVQYISAGGRTFRSLAARLNNNTSIPPSTTVTVTLVVNGVDTLSVDLTETARSAIALGAAVAPAGSTYDVRVDVDETTPDGLALTAEANFN